MGRLPAAKRREQLLDTAAVLFAQLGYSGATTAQLAKKAGVTEPIIYRHFASKRDLFIALIERTGRETIHQWEQELGGAKDSAERLARLLGDNPMVTESGQTVYRVIVQAMTEVDDEKIREALKDHMTKLHAFLVGEVKRAQADHKVTVRFSAEIIAWMLMHLGMGYGVLRALDLPDHGRDEAGMHVQDVITRVLVGKAATPENRPGS
jgi:AcrR family transcriptional regulator